MKILIQEPLAVRKRTKPRLRSDQTQGPAVRPPVQDSYFYPKSRPARTVAAKTPPVQMDKEKDPYRRRRPELTATLWPAIRSRGVRWASASSDSCRVIVANGLLSLRRAVKVAAAVRRVVSQSAGARVRSSSSSCPAACWPGSWRRWKTTSIACSARIAMPSA